jgi:DNA-binding transcriptional ArsR family regulator
MSSAHPEKLRPTLWRTCRVLANKTRLKILRSLYKHPEQQVTEVAKRLGFSLSLTSQSLRALNARGMLRARRDGRVVFYSLGANRSIPSSALLLKAILLTFTTDKNPEENIFRYATAFTHPRRILIIKALCEHPMQLKELAMKTGVPVAALNRHLRKLASRGFLKQTDCWYICSVPRHKFARALLLLAKIA